MTRINAYGPSLLVLATTAAVLLAGPVAVRQITFHHTEANIQEASLRLEANQILEQINQAYGDIAIVVEPSVVHISTEHIVADRWGGPARKASSGSGWVYDEEGHIVTNNHVIEDAVNIEVQLSDGRIHEAEVLGADPSTDIAVLKIEPGRLHAAAKRDTRLEPVRQGDLVFAFGSPFDFRFSMSSGVVSGKGRSVGVIRSNRGQGVGYENFIQVDAAINPGNSGGPLTDYRGRVIAMNTAIATRGGGGLEEGQFAGIGLAIPIEMIEPVVRQVIDNDGIVTKGYLGVFVVDDPKRLQEELAMSGFDRAGVYVAHVGIDSPAAGAGLRYGDIVTSLNDRTITNSDALQRTARSARDGDLELTVERYVPEIGGWDFETIALPRAAALRLEGVTLLPLTATVGEALDELGFEGRGVRIARLEVDGPADAAGMQRGDVVTHVNEEPVESVDQLRSVISSILPGEEAALDVWRYEPERDAHRRLTLHVALSELAGQFGRAPIHRMPMLGIERMATATPRLAEEWKVDFHPGVMILAMTDSAELREKIPPGSIIVEVRGEQIRNVTMFQQAIGRRDLRNGLRLAIVTPDGGRQDVTVRVE